MKLYNLRLYHIAIMDSDVDLCEAYRVGSIIASNGIFKCKEVFDKGEIPIVDKRKDYAVEEGEHRDSFLIHLPSRIVRKRYIVLREDFCEKNKISLETAKILHKSDEYAHMAAKVIGFEQNGAKIKLKKKWSNIWKKS